MIGKTFSEKLFAFKSGKAVKAGDIVYVEPDLILSHDNTASIKKTFEKMGGNTIKYPNRIVVVIDHDAPATSVKIANDHQTIRNFVEEQSISNFYDAGNGICHQLMSNHALPGMLIVGSDSHTCTSGAYNTFAAGIDRTETAGLWLAGETWFRVPETIKINLTGKLSMGVYSKDVALWIMGLITTSGANYQAIEYHGDGVNTLNMSERMTLCNLASEMGAKTAIFPPDEILMEWMDNKYPSRKFGDLYWADEDAIYSRVIEINLSELVPVAAIPHQVDNIQLLTDVDEIELQEVFLGTCTNGRLDDLRVAAEILDGNKVKTGIQFLVAPASKEIYLEAMREGTIEKLVSAGATILSSSCGPCLGKGQGIPADGCNVLSTANRNFLGRMGNKKASVFLASPATIAASAIAGKIVDPRTYLGVEITSTVQIPEREKKETVVQVTDDRYHQNSWDYRDVDDFNTDAMFAGNLTYDINSSNPEQIVPHLFVGLDETFSKRVSKGDVIIAGYNFGCGSSREHPSVGLAHAGVSAVIVKSVSRIFYRSAINQGLPIIVMPEVVDNYNPEEEITIDLTKGLIQNGDMKYNLPKLPSELLDIFSAGGLIKYYQQKFKEE